MKKQAMGNRQWAIGNKQRGKGAKGQRGKRFCFIRFIASSPHRRISFFILLCFIAHCPLPIAYNFAYADEKGKFTIARLKYSGGGDWYNDPSIVPNWLKELKRRTKIDCNEKQDVVQVTDKNLYQYPIIFMTGHGNIKFNDKEIEALRFYLTHGGFLYADDDYGMDKSFRREIERVLPDKKLEELPFEHPIYHCYYDFPNGLPKIHEHDGKPPKGYAMFHEGRMILFYTYETNITDGVVDPQVHKDPPEIRELAFKMAINMAVYVLTN